MVSRDSIQRLMDDSDEAHNIRSRSKGKTGSSGRTKKCNPVVKFCSYFEFFKDIFVLCVI